MSRRTQPCRYCSGRTRHDDRRCATCRNPFKHIGQSNSLGRFAITFRDAFTPTVARAQAALAELSQSLRIQEHDQ